MEPKLIAKQMIDFQKTTFDNAFQAVVVQQNQTEKMTNTMLDQTVWLPKEGRKAIDEWVKAYKKGRENFKKSVDDNFKKVEDLFAVTK
ncbi:MAG: hypothetical protein JSW04_10580 [Desulfobacterales bacterium]|nr:MAG: hypothetical protein JSV38_11890 [Desulfobacterales bacterium]UCD88893.1 MAG: hypothetical protein JSW04_10580 [Desulfobacterales bacterium]